jgi:hypothetical protein
MLLIGAVSLTMKAAGEQARNIADSNRESVATSRKANPNGNDSGYRWCKNSRLEWVSKDWRRSPPLRRRVNALQSPRKDPMADVIRKETGQALSLPSFSCLADALLARN